MNTRAFVILLALLSLTATGAFAQKLEKIMALQLEYWRAFHEQIQQTIIVTNSGEIALNTTITPIRQSGEIPSTPKHAVKAITQQDLASVLKFFNNANARQFFATHKPVDQPDGASLSISITQNLFSLSFRSQDAFTGGGTRYDSALGRIALELLQLAGVSIPKNELY